MKWWWISIINLKKTYQSQCEAAVAERQHLSWVITDEERGWDITSSLVPDRFPEEATQRTAVEIGKSLIFWGKHDWKSIDLMLLWDSWEGRQRTFRLDNSRVSGMTGNLRWLREKSLFQCSALFHLQHVNLFLINISGECDSLISLVDTP